MRVLAKKENEDEEADGYACNHQLMFSVYVWGTVAEMIGAVGTSGAAICAATVYISDRRREARAQAQLVRVEHADSSNREQASVETTFTVTNDSDQPISGFYLFMKENPKYLPSEENDFVSADTVKFLRRFFPIWAGKGSLLMGDQKKQDEVYVTELPEVRMGLRMPMQALMKTLDGPSRIAGGSEGELTLDQPLYSNAMYHIIFRDSHARAWMLQSLGHLHMRTHAGDLRRLSRNFSSGRNSRNSTELLPGWKRVPLNALRDIKRELKWFRWRLSNRP